MGLRSPGNEIVWQTIKNHFDGKIIEGIKHYHRSVPSLSTLYESVSFYNNKPCKKSESLFVHAAAESAKSAFKFRTPTAVTRLEHLTPNVFPTSTSPCLPYTTMGFKTKLEAWPTALLDAKRIKFCIMNEIPCTLPPSMVFAKSKICYRWEQKTRAIWGKSLSLLLIEAMFVKESWKVFREGETPAAYHIQPFHGSYRKLHSDLRDMFSNTEYLGLDFKKYDTSLPPWLIAMAFKVLESNIDFTKYTDGSQTEPGIYKLWTRIKRTMIDTTFLMPDGWMFQKHTGVDSGSYIFQLIENICTYIMIHAALSAQGISHDKMYVLGDDSLVSCRNQKKINFQALCDYIQSEFGVTVSTDKSFVTSDLSKVKFLGRYMGDGLPKRNVCDIVLSLLYPGQPDDSVIDLAQRCVALYYENAIVSYPCESFIQAVFEKIPAEIRNSLEHRTDLPWPRRWVKKFERMGIPVPKCKLPTTNQLFMLFSYRDITVLC